jgi:23S rRNA (pseudouridine1915-N3)-methyltransferase
MKLAIMAAGRLKEEIEQTHFRRYEDLFRAAARGVRLPPLHMIEFAESRAGSAEDRKAEEARAFLNKRPAGSVLIALDEGGELLFSAELARLIQRHRESAAPALAFCIGGPDGHGPALLEAASLKLSLGRITLPHGLARIVTAEQLYRALTILQGHPYHRA